MARPRKTGLDYFPFDVDFFEDEKIVAIAGEFGVKGELAAVKLLCAVYRNGYFVEWTDMLRLKILRQLPGVSAELFDQILNRLVRWGFFDASLFGSVKVLTSEGIQRRYFEITKRCQKRENFPYLLVNVTLTGVNVAETRVNVTETPQIKGNKTKEKESPNGDKKKAVVVQPSLFGKEKQKKQKSAKEPPPIPAVNEVLEYFKTQDAEKRLQNWEGSARLFFDTFNADGWVNKYGRCIANWQSEANKWIFYQEERERKEKHESTETDRFSERRGTEPRTESRKGFKGTF
jgi:hypothetical protein